MGRKPQKIITVRTVGKLAIELAADLLAPLFLKIHERNQNALCLLSSKSRARISDTFK